MFFIDKTSKRNKTIRNNISFGLPVVKEYISETQRGMFSRIKCVYFLVGLEWFGVIYSQGMFSNGVNQNNL